MADYPNVGADMPMGNYNAANSAMQLTPQEKILYMHHLANLSQGAYPNQDGSVSSLYQMSFGAGNPEQTYNAPTIYGNQKLTPDAAQISAEQTGLQNFPSYPNEFTAENRYQRMHNYLELDKRPSVSNAPWVPFGSMMPRFQNR